jgi:hypothetical protein
LESFVRFYTGCVVFMGICFAAPEDSERLKQVAAVEALLHAGRVAEAHSAFRNLLARVTLR